MTHPPAPTPPTTATPTAATPTAAFRVARLQPEHVPAVAALHVREFQGFFLSRLGPGVLREYYAAIAEQGHLGFVALDPHRLVGFVVGYARGEGFYRRLVRRRGLRLLCAALPSVARSPSVAWTILQKLHARDAEDSGDRRCAWLSSIAVRADARRTGVGALLLEEFLRDAAQLAFAEVGLETDARDNDAVQRFYLGHGFRRTRTFEDVNGRPMHEYRHACRLDSSRD